MIKYKKIGFEDLPVINYYLQREDVQGCEWSGVNLLTWNSFGLEYAIVDEHLVLRFVLDGNLTFTMPLPPVPKDIDPPVLAELVDQEAIARVLRQLRDECFAHHQPFFLTNLNEWHRELLQRHFPGEFEFSPPMRDRYDYILLREKVIALEGKEMRPKRQHVYQFPRFYPNHEYRVLEPSMFPECLQLLRTWNENAEAIGRTDGNLSKVMEYESIGIVFNNWERFNATGGALYVDEKMVAFTYGAPINVNTFDLCVEKGDINYKGVYTKIRHEFMQHIPEQYIYINLEEDMGLPGLRRAKSSYHPERLITKDRATCHPQLSPEVDACIKNEVRQLMKTIFNDSEQALDIFFGRVFDHCNNYCQSVDGHVVASLQALPYPVLYHGEELTAVYIYAVGTHPDYRDQHRIARIFKYLHLQLYRQSKAFSTLLIEQESLQQMYEKFGYAQVGVCPQLPQDVIEQGFESYDRKQPDRNCTIMQDEAKWNVLQEYSRFNKSYYLATSRHKGMVRIINVTVALQQYARVHPDTCMMLHIVGDNDICENNGYYKMENGNVCRAANDKQNFTTFTIGQLAEFIFKDDPMEMPLVLL